MNSTKAVAQQGYVARFGDGTMATISLAPDGNYSNALDKLKRTKVGANDIAKLWLVFTDEDGEDVFSLVYDNIPTSTASPEQPKRARKESNSRPARWQRAVAKGMAGHDAATGGAAQMQEALEELEELRGEYEEWKDNLPENFEQSALGEKLSTVCDLSFEWSADSDSLDDGENLLREAEDADLPRGFGKD